MTNQEFDNWIAANFMGPPEWKEAPSSHSLSVELNYSVPKYTESISDAFQVVEKMLQDIKCSFDFTYHCELGWRAIFHSCDKKYNAPLKGVDTAPLAICLAAKKAIET